MKQRLQLQDLADHLALSTGMPYDKVEAYLHHFFALAEEALLADQLVKIKGLGDFKITGVAPRTSVDVNSKQTIVIKSHARISFSADSAVNDTLNTPFAHLTAVELCDEALPHLAEADEAHEVYLKQLEQAEREMQEREVQEVAVEPEEVAVASEELEERDSLDSSESSEETENSESSESSEVSELSDNSEPSELSDNSEPSELSDHSDNADNSEPSELSDHSDNSDSSEPSAPTLPPSKRSPHWRPWLIGFLLVALLIIAYLLGRYQSQPTATSTQPASPTVPTATPQPAVAQSDTIHPDTSIHDFTDLLPTPEEVSSAPQPAQSEAKASTPQPAAPKTTTPQPTTTQPTAQPTSPAEPDYDSKYPQVTGSSHQIIGTQRTLTITTGEGLMQIARKEYGDAHLYKHIVLYNNIKDPNNVPLGTTIKLPKLRKRKA